jgi:hypothetical protein
LYSKFSTFMPHCVRRARVAPESPNVNYAFLVRCWRGAWSK